MKNALPLIFTLVVSALFFPSPGFTIEKKGSKPMPVGSGGFSATPTLSGYFFAGSEQRDIAETFGLKLGYEKVGKSFTDSLGVEAAFNYFITKSKTDSDITGYLLRLEAIYPINLWAKWVPFLAIGGGGIIIDAVSNTETKPLFNYGAGVKYFLEDYLALRADARHLLVYHNVNTRNNFEIGIGLTYYFGKERKKEEPAPPATEHEEKEKPITETKPAEIVNTTALAIPPFDSQEPRPE